MIYIEISITAKSTQHFLTSSHVPAKISQLSTFNFLTYFCQVRQKKEEKHEEKCTTYTKFFVNFTTIGFLFNCLIFDSFQDYAGSSRLFPVRSARTASRGQQSWSPARPHGQHKVLSTASFNVWRAIIRNCPLQLHAIKRRPARLFQSSTDNALWQDALHGANRKNYFHSPTYTERDISELELHQLLMPRTKHHCQCNPITVTQVLCLILSFEPHSST